MSIDPETLRTVMRQWATGVTVVAARDGAQAHGMTVNSFTSASLNPPLVLICLERITRTHALVQRSRAFAVSFLGESQQALSDRFAQPHTEGEDRFADLETHTAVTGAPILRDNIGYLDCAVVATHDTGTHTLFVAEVLAAHTGHTENPLLYYNRNYRRLAD